MNKSNKNTINKVSNPVVPTGVEFDSETIFRLGREGDNWCLTWAADDSQIVSMDDGNWMTIDGMHNHLFRLVGESKIFEREDIPGYPIFKHGNGGWFDYGIISIDGVLYSAVSKTPDLNWSGPFIGVKLFRSENNGKTWQRVDQSGGLQEYAPAAPAAHLVSVEEILNGLAMMVEK